MRIISQNVNLIRSEDKLRTLKANINAQIFEIACFQETGLKDDDLIQVNKTLSLHQMPELVCHDTSPDPFDHKGKTIILSKNHDFKKMKSIKSGTGQFIIFYCKYINRDFILGNFYGRSTIYDPESKNTFQRFEAAFLPILHSLRDPMILIIGDFNLILSKKDHSNLSYRRKPNAESALYKFITQNDLKDMVNPCDADI